MKSKKKYPNWIITSKILLKRVYKEINQCVPFQTCPVCSGTGRIKREFINTTAGNLTETCPCCNGAMVIPMAVIPEKKNG